METETDTDTQTARRTGLRCVACGAGMTALAFTPLFGPRYAAPVMMGLLFLFLGGCLLIHGGNPAHPGPLVATYASLAMMAGLLVLYQRNYFAEPFNRLFLPFNAVLLGAVWCLALWFERRG